MTALLVFNNNNASVKRHSGHPKALPAPQGQGVVATTLLRVEHVVKKFGGLRAVDGVSFTLDRGEFLAVVGPQRLRKNHASQPNKRGLQAGRGKDILRGGRRNGVAALREGEAGHVPRLPGAPAVSRKHGA